MAKTFAAGEGGHLEEHNKWAELIEDLQDPDTDPNKYPSLQGPEGPQGEDGKSAYEIWLEAGNNGDENDFLEDIKGEQGNQGNPGPPGSDGADGETPGSMHTTYTERDIPEGKFEFTWTEDPDHPLRNFEEDQLSVHLNGILLTPADDYTVTFNRFDSSFTGLNELTVSLRQPASEGDVLIASVLYAFGEGESVGPKGEDGDSAYEIWLAQGNSGSEQDFLDSLKGDPGEKGQDGEGVHIVGLVDSAADLPDPATYPGVTGDIIITDDDGHGHVFDDKVPSWTDIGPLRGPEGKPGVDGDDGDSAFETWLQQPGNEGKTEAEFLESLKGADGDSAYEIWLSEGNTGSEQDFLDSLKGEPGSGGGLDFNPTRAGTIIQANDAIDAWEEGRSITVSVDDPPEDGDFVDGDLWFVIGPSAGSAGSVTTADVDLTNPVTRYKVGRHTASTQEDANKVFVAEIDRRVGGDGVSNMVYLTQQEYDLITPDPNTVYVIDDEEN